MTNDNSPARILFSLIAAGCLMLPAALWYAVREAWRKVRGM